MSRSDYALMHAHTHKLMDHAQAATQTQSYMSMHALPPTCTSSVVTIKHTMTVTVGGLCKVDANNQS